MFLMFILSGPVEQVILLYLIVSWIRDVSVYYPVCTSCYRVGENCYLSKYSCCLVAECYIVTLCLGGLFIA